MTRPAECEPAGPTREPARGRHGGYLAPERKSRDFLSGGVTVAGSRLEPPTVRFDPITLSRHPCIPTKEKSIVISVLLEREHVGMRVESKQHTVDS
jgi:hypothetical protein